MLFIVGYYLLHWLAPAASWWLDLLDTFSLYLFVPAVPLSLLGLLFFSRPVLMFCVVPLALFAFYFSGLFLPQLRRPAEDETAFKVMTYNILGRNRNFLDVQKLVEAENPDVIAVQELSLDQAVRLQSLLAGRYPYRAMVPRASYTGVGVLSRFPIKRSDVFMASGTGSLSQYLVLDVRGRDVNLFNLHPDHAQVKFVRREGFPPYLVERFETDRQTAQVESLMRTVEKTEGPVIVMGDFNLTDQTRQYRRVTRTLRDTYREVGWGFGFTFPANGWMLRLPLPFPVVRIDYVFHSSELVPVEAHIGDSAGSDHRPVIVRLGFKAG